MFDSILETKVTMLNMKVGVKVGMRKTCKIYDVTLNLWYWFFARGEMMF